MSPGVVLPIGPAAVARRPAVAWSEPAAADPGSQAPSERVAGIESRLRRLGVREHHLRAARLVAAASGLSIAQAVTELGLVGAETLARAIAADTGRGYLAPHEADAVDPGSVAGLSLQDGQACVPAGRSAGRLRVAVSEAEAILEAQTRYHGEPVEILIASARTLERLRRRCFANTAGALRAAVQRWERAADPASPGAGREVEAVLGSLLRHACYAGASDLFLHRTMGGIGTVKLHVNGTGQFLAALPGALHDRLLNKLVSETSSADALARAPQEAGLEGASLPRLEGAEVDRRYAFRLQLHQGHGVAEREAVIRILDREAEQADFESLGFDEPTGSRLLDYTRASTGLVLVCGPTGSGKTTTLYAMLRRIDPLERSIRTIEKPIEYRHPMWHQMEVAAEVAEAEGMRLLLNSALRMAPHVLLMGEIREDREVAGRVISAAFTGHLVFSTLHVTSAALAITRLRHIGVSSENLAAALRGVLAQRLILLLCADCSVPDDCDDGPPDGLEASAAWRPRRAVGCARCGWTGYRGRRLVYELLHVDDGVRERIERGATAREIAQAGFAAGGTLWHCGLRLVAEGRTSRDELRRVADPGQ
jgi:type II secretory ATPase GspE/PulE/Tfp pilus assembly ATPase PilB-like protein